MPWTNTVLKILKKEFGEEPFLVNEAAKVLHKNTDYSKVAMRQAFHQLVKEGSLVRSSRGIYEVHHIRPLSSGGADVSANVTVTFTSKVLIEAENILKSKGIDYMITGPSALTRFHHHLTRRLIHLIYVVKGAGENASIALEEKVSELSLTHLEIKLTLCFKLLKRVTFSLFVNIQVLKEILMVELGIERAIVDMYFEVTRYRIPFSEMEVGRIIANVFREEKVDISRLLRFASRRGIRSEFESIVKELVPSLQLRGGVLNEPAKAVIAGIRG